MFFYCLLSYQKPGTRNRDQHSVPISGTGFLVPVFWYTGFWIGCHGPNSLPAVLLRNKLANNTCHQKQYHVDRGITKELEFICSVKCIGS